MNCLIINTTREGGNGFLTPSIQGLVELGHTITWLGTQFGNFKPYGIICHPDYTELDLIEYIKFNDLVLLNIHPLFLESYNIPFGLLCNLLNTYRSNNFMMFDCGDYTGEEWGPDEYRQLKYKHYLKREAYKQYPNIAPFLGLSYNKQLYIEKEKDISVSFLGSNTGTQKKGFRRPELVEMIKKIPGSYASLSPVPFDKYVDIMNRSKISVSCWGAGYICYRDMEILSSNSLIALMESPTNHYDCLIDDESCIKYTNISELMIRCYELLEDEKKYLDMSSRMNYIVRENFTRKKMAEKLINYNSMKRRENYYI